MGIESFTRKLWQTLTSATHVSGTVQAATQVPAPVNEDAHKAPDDFKKMIADVLAGDFDKKSLPELRNLSEQLNPDKNKPLRKYLQFRAKKKRFMAHLQLL